MRRYIVLIFCFLALPMVAQELTEEDKQYALRVQTEIRRQLSKLTTELHQMADEERMWRLSESNLQSAYYVRSMEEKVQSLARRMQAFDVRWEAFNASNLTMMADDDALMELLAQAQLLKQSVADTLAVQQNKCTAVKDFNAAEQFITAGDTIYDKLYKQAFAMSFVQKMSPQLEKLKAQEQLQMTEIQSHYDKAKAAADLVPQFGKRAMIVNECYYGIKTRSDKIQQLKYEPLLQRMKDYLMSIAYVAVILIFVNMVVSKWQAAKKAKEAAAKQLEMLKKEHDYPTI